MRKTSLFTSILLLAATMAVAQQSYPSSTPTSQDQSAISTQSTVQGCLSGTENNYTIADQKSGTTFKLSGSNDSLKAHVGHLIQLTGTSSSDTAGSTFKFDSVKMISSDCSAATTPSTSNDASAAVPQSDSAATTAAATTAPVAPVPAEQPAATPMPEPAAALPQSDQPAAAPATPVASNDMSAQTTAAPQTTTTTTTEAAPAAPATGDTLPQTASPLPLLGLLGFGSLLTGFWARFKK